MAASTSSSMGSMSPPSTSTFQESDGIRKSGPILLLSGSKKRGQPAHAVLSERALELYDSEKAYRKKKANRAIVDLSKCFNVSQQNCPKTREPCVCLLMPDECFLFRTENTNETSEWYCNLLSAVISSRALHLGRPVFANEFFECVWDVTICSQQPLKLKKVPAPPNNSTEFANSINICSKLPELAGHKRLCFYPHTIIICKVGIEPAHTGLPKSGIPPFRTMDFVEFSRHFIAQYGQVDKYFLMRIGRTSPMGACEVWIQCESEDTAIEVNRKLQEIIRRETEKKQQALMAIRGQQHHHQAQLHGQQQQQQPLSLSCDQHFSPSCAAYVAPHYSLAPNSPTGTGSPMALGSPSGMGGSGSGRITDKSESFPLVSSGIEQLEPISEDEQLNSTGQTAQTAATALPATGRKKSSSLSQSAREKRLELRERKAKVDTLEEEEQRFQQRQMLIQQQQQQYAGGWTPTKRYLAMKSFRPFDGVAGRLLSMEKADSLVLLGYGPGAEEETEDSGGTLRMIPCDQDGSQAASRSSSSLNLSGANLSSRPAPATVAAAHAAHSSWSRSSSDGQLVQTYVECHASAHNDDEERDSSGTSTSSTEEDSSDYLLNNHFHHPHHHPPPPHHDEEKARKKLQRRKAKNARRQQRQLTSTSGGGDSLDAGTEADQSCSCSESVASSSGQDEQKLAAAAAATQAANAPSDVKKKHSFPAEMLPPQQPHSTNPAAAAAANASEYTLMDSCSSDSFSHLAVPQQQQWDRQNGSGYFPEEFCSYTSDSADSCYSSMANGQLNPRAFSFSSTSDAAPARAHFGPNKLVGPQPHFYQTQPQQHPAAAKWTAAMAHRNYLLQHLQQPPAHFSPPKSYGSGQQMSQHQHLDSSSSSRFSMETSLTTPLEEEDERQVTFADQDQHGQALTNATAQQSAADADDSLRKRAFSLGSKSWLTKPFSKLSSSSGHGAPSSARQQRSSYGGGASRSGSSSLVGSIHADLCSVQEQTSQIQLSHEHRLGSAPSFASSTAAGPVTAVQDHQHARSDSIGSNHSAAVSLPGLSHRLRKKQPSEEHLKNEDLVELEFLPNKLPFSNRSSQCVAITPTDNSLRGRTSSYDEQPYNNNGYMAAPGYFGGPQRKMSHQCGNHHAGGGGVSAAAPRGRGSACSLNYTIGGGGSGTSGSTTAAAQQQQQQRLRPSEFFIRSIQQQQREQQKQKQRHRLKNDFPLQEVQCFIAPDEREKIDAMTSRDSLSMRSQRSGSGSCSQPFETIEEGTTSVQVSQQKQERAVKRQRTQSRLSSRSVHSTSSGSPESQLPTGSSNNNNNNNDDDYVLGEVKPKGATALTA